MVDIFKALSEESRLRIIALLVQGDLCVCEIEDCLKMTQSNVSRHLIVLKNCGILKTYKKAQWVYYGINTEFINLNKNLWLYITEKIDGSPNFKIGIDERLKCLQKDLCNSKA